MRFTIASLFFILFYAAVLFASLRQANVYWERILELTSYTAFGTAILIAIHSIRFVHFLAFGLFGFIFALGPHVPADRIDALSVAMKIGSSRSMFLHSLIQTHIALVVATLAMFATRAFSGLPRRAATGYSSSSFLAWFAAAFGTYLTLAYISCRDPHVNWDIGLEFGAYASYGAAAVIGASLRERGMALIAYALFGFTFHFGPIVPYWIIDGVAHLFGHDAFTAWDNLRVIVGALFGVAAGGIALLATQGVTTIIDRKPASRP